MPLETEVELEDGDLAYMMSEAPSTGCEGSSVSMPPLGAVCATVPLVDDSGVVSTAEASIGLLPVLRPPSSEPSNPSAVVPRRTGRVGAGQHSNVHHLPRAISAGGLGAPDSPACGANAVMALFRPWN